MNPNKEQIRQLRERITSVEKRNHHVEVEKAFETSLFRRTIITVITYVVASIFLIIINAPDPLLTALIPTGGFFLSTLTGSKKVVWWWAKHYHKNP